MTAEQLNLFPPPPPRIPLFNRGWVQCECNLVFWVWPLNRLPSGSCTGTTGTPDLRPFRLWTCGRDINRASPHWPAK